MSLIQYLRYNIYIIGIFGLLFSKYIEPNNSADYKEILTIYKKDREYSRLINDKLVYFIEGPTILSIYSRKAFPENSKKDKSYKFEVIIDEVKRLIAKHDYRKDSNVYNSLHPGHAYTLAGKDVINIPSGTHRIELRPLNNKDKILVRATTNAFKAKGKVSEIYPVNYDYVNKAILKNKNQKFWILSNEVGQVNKISFKVDGSKNKSKLIRLISRATFGNKQYDEGESFVDANSNGKRDYGEPYTDYPDDKAYYKFKVRKDDQLISTHHMFSEISKGVKIIDDPSILVSKWRTTLINVPKGEQEHEYEIELISPDSKNILFKIQEDKR